MPPSKAVTITPNHGEEPSLDIRRRRPPRFHFVGGKGGVGKTTCAAAIGLEAATRGLRVLVASTDPAPSLGDALNVPLAFAPRRVRPAKGRLWAVEIDSARSLQRWLDRRRSTLGSIAVEGTWLDREDVERLLRLSLPGIDELAALLEISRLAESARFDLIVVDTAPTGHTLRMLAMPQMLRDVAVVFDRMREKQRVMEEALRGRWSHTVDDALIAEMVETAQALAALLRDEVGTRVSWVTLPEPMAIGETADAVRALQDSSIHIAAIIVNRLTPRSLSACAHCDARRAFESTSLRELPAAAAILAVEAMDAEPRGTRALNRFAAQLARGISVPAKARSVRRWRAKVDGAPITPADLLPPSLRLVLSGGKGGVGKTTAAAALALSAATRWPDRRVLLISTDPAHSLGDVFGFALADRARPLPDGPPNLWVRELDASAVIGRIRARYREAIDQVFDRLGGGDHFDAAHDRSVMRSLIDLAPPGLDELAAVLEITETITDAAPDWDLVVMDTAPTGHALRLLEMPGLIQEWVRALMAILLKYQGVARLGDLGALLLNMSKGLGRLRELLVNPQRTAFIAVTRPAALPRLETTRLVRRLKRLQIPVAAIVVNAVGRGGCKRCLTVATTQRRELQATRRAMTALKIQTLVVTVALTPPPLGLPGLRDWARTGWHESTLPAAISSGDVTATYLYCIVKSATKPSTARTPEGLPGAERPQAVAAGASLWLIVAAVPVTTYGTAVLERQLSDMDWVGSVALAHESVVEHFATRAGMTVIPMKLFTMFSSVNRAVADIAKRNGPITAAMRRISGAEEWGVRILREPSAATRRPATAKAASGAAFLAAKKKAKDDVKLKRQAAAEAALDAFDQLAAHARETRRRDDVPAPGVAPPLLDAAFLVPSASRGRFKKAATQAAARCAGAGAQMTLSGPWPAYNFVQSENDE